MRPDMCGYLVFNVLSKFAVDCGCQRPCNVAGWFVYPGGEVTESCDLMVATRDINPGDEITFGASHTALPWFSRPANPKLTCVFGCVQSMARRKCTRSGTRLSASVVQWIVVASFPHTTGARRPCSASMPDISCGLPRNTLQNTTPLYGVFSPLHVDPDVQLVVLWLPSLGPVRPDCNHER
jgi:hypothetical protein